MMNDDTRQVSEAEKAKPDEQADVRENKTAVMNEPETAISSEEGVVEEISGVATESEHSVQEWAELLAKAEAKAGENWDALLRARAELENFQRRATREIENAHKFGLERLLNEILPVKDSLELGLAACSEESASVAQVSEGIELTLKMLESALEKFGLVTVNPLNEKFDPEQQQAMSVQEVEGVKADTVLQVFQKGYVLNGRLLRPAMVIVAK
jgi:molecular chaperone GrpE